MTKIKCRAWVLVILLVAVVFISGCETLKGAAQGFKRDWNNFTGWERDIAW
jgi:predicted small secreted protein